jgi:hypothetical protein
MQTEYNMAYGGGVTIKWIVPIVKRELITFMWLVSGHKKLI